MKISVLTGTGSGETALAAFDSALRAAGVANYNLIRLSSVIPAQAEVVVGNEAPRPSGEWGDKLYCVYAECEAVEAGREAWAGVGWVQSPDDGRGLFVEHSGGSQAEVERLIRESLASMTDGRDVTFGEVQMAVAGVTCEHRPVCAVAMAPYMSESWAE
jgi:arginine decarboxylase